MATSERSERKGSEALRLRRFMALGRLMTLHQPFWEPPSVVNPPTGIRNDLQYRHQPQDRLRGGDQ
jgi:hypothetical protein